MTMFVIQAAIFIAVAFGLGCLFGCWLKGRSRSNGAHSGAAAAITHEGAARTVTAGELAAPRPHYEPETSPQPASALASKPEPADSKTSVVADAPAKAASKPVKKASKPKVATSKPAKSAASKSAAPKAVASKPRATATETAKAKPEKPVATKSAAGKPKTPKAKPAPPDNLKQIKGVGPQIEAKLNAAGINSFAQIAAWSKKQHAEFAEQLSFAGRIEREEWVSQAKILAKGGSTDFAKRVAKGEVASSADSKPKRGGKK